MSQEVRVTVSGSNKAGKTTIAELIVRTLRKVGVRCDASEAGVLNLQDHVAALNEAGTHVTVETTGAVKAVSTAAGTSGEIVTPLVALKAQQAAIDLLLLERATADPGFDPTQHPASRAVQLGGEAIRKLESGR